jgi:hypothetical protein
MLRVNNVTITPTGSQTPSSSSSPNFNGTQLNNGTSAAITNALSSGQVAGIVIGTLLGVCGLLVLGLIWLGIIVIPCYAGKKQQSNSNQQQNMPAPTTLDEKTLISNNGQQDLVMT